MKIIALHGNPQPIRQTEIVLDKYLDGLKTIYNEAEVTRFNTQTLTLMPCERCDACKTGRIDDCIIKDDMTFIYNIIRESDLLIFSFPIIWSHLPGKMKTFIDRFHALDLDEFVGRRRKLVVLSTYREDNINLSGYNEVVQTFRYIAKRMNLEFIDHLGVRVDEEGKVNDETALTNVYELGKKI